MTLATCIATGVEKRRPLPGDTIVPEPMFSVTHAITIDAPIERVWPWRSLLFAVAAFGHRIMEARHLRGIQRRAERTQVAEALVRNEGSQTMKERPARFPDVRGHVSRGLETVREAFVENFARRRELGGACCAYHHGEKVVDLWGGVRNKLTGELWEQDTMVLVYSATKGLAAMTLALAHSRGWLDYEERVATYWPEFAQQGKETITVRQLLAHQAGLFAFDEPVDRSVVADLDRLAAVLARQKPAWEPGTRQGYHAMTLGFYEGELLRRVDPQQLTAYRVLLVWMYDRTGSLLVVTLMHASLTASTIFIFTPLAAGMSFLTYMWVLAAALWVVVAAVAAAYGGQLSRQPLRSRAA